MEFVDCLDYVELDLDHFSVYSKKFNDIILKIGPEILTVFDLGSGILRRPQNIILKDEPTVDDAVKMGFDLISFSGDKLLGGPQAGFLVGRKKLIKKMESNHLLRALRPGKLTLAALELAICDYLSDKKLIENNFVFQRLSLCENQLEVSAKSLKDGLELLNIAC